MNDNYFELYFRKNPVASSIQEAVLGVDTKPVDFRILKVNEALLSSLSKSELELVGRLLSDVLSEMNYDYRSKVYPLMCKALKENKLVSEDIYQIKKKHWIRYQVTPCDKNVVACYYEDVTKEYEKESEVNDFMNMNLDMLCITNKAGRIYRVNKKFEEVTGYKASELEGKNLQQLVHELDKETTINAISSSIKKKTKSYTSRLQQKKGNYIYIDWNIRAGNETYIYSSGRDVTEKYMIEERLKKMAVRDELTGAFNRHYFEMVIQSEMEKSDQADIPISLIILDLDHFKNVNDTFGHPIGDDVLKMTAKVTVETIREQDVLVRLGGEEFIILMPNTSLKGATKVAEKIRIAMEEVSHPKVGRQTASFGVATKLRGESFQNWYRRVDKALYKAKQSGRNCVISALENSNNQMDMTILEWTVNWECGNEQLDLQHRTLHEEMKSLLQMSYEVKPNEEVLPYVRIIVNEMKEHFLYEEKLLAESGFPGYEVHRNTHTHLIKNAEKIMMEFEKGKVKTTAFFSFLIDDLLLGHLLEADTKFFPYIKKTKI